MTTARWSLRLRFVTEVASLVTWLIVGLGISGVGGAIVAPVAAGAVWGRWMAPKSRHRLVDPRRLAAELVFFAVPSFAVAALGRVVLGAIVFVAATTAALAVRTTSGVDEALVGATPPRPRGVQ